MEHPTADRHLYVDVESPEKVPIEVMVKFVTQGREGQEKQFYLFKMNSYFDHNLILKNSNCPGGGQSNSDILAVGHIGDGRDGGDGSTLLHSIGRFDLRCNGGWILLHNSVGRTRLHNSGGWTRWTLLHNSGGWTSLHECRVDQSSQ